MELVTSSLKLKWPSVENITTSELQALLDIGNIVLLVSSAALDRLHILFNVP